MMQLPEHEGDRNAANQLRSPSEVAEAPKAGMVRTMCWRKEGASPVHNLGMRQLRSDPLPLRL